MFNLASSYLRSLSLLNPSSKCKTLSQFIKMHLNYELLLLYYKRRSLSVSDLVKFPNRPNPLVFDITYKMYEIN